MEEHQDKPAVSLRTAELVVAALLLIFGAVVMWDTHRIGASWAEDGPEAGYFPFYVALIIVVGSALNIWNALKLKGESNPHFVLRGQLKLVMSVVWPTVAYVVAIAGVGPIPGLGIYEASVLFIAWFMWRLGKYVWYKIVPVSLGVAIFFFLLFEIWFKVPLPKGPIEALLGFN